MADSPPTLLTFEAYEKLNDELEELSMKATRLFFKRFLKYGNACSEKNFVPDNPEFAQIESLYQAYNDRIEAINNTFLNCKFTDDPRFDKYKIKVGSDFSVVVTDENEPRIFAGHIFDKEPIFNPTEVERFYLALDQNCALAQYLIGKRPGDKIVLQTFHRKIISYLVVCVSKETT